tara:strand:+ start:1127 stop:1723 length:597 start_codon:yes stop_codon:yes gene_type:complete
MLKNKYFLRYITLALLVGITSYLFVNSDFYNLKCVVSSIDGNKYCVRERKRINEAADILATVVNKCEKLIEYLVKKYPENDGVKRLKSKFNKTKCVETLPTSELTAYSENKGQKVAFCLSKKKNGTKLIDINTLTFVAIHELAHIMSVTIGHNDEFWDNFKFLLDNAVNIKLYDPVDYKNKPENYCGLEITDNPYYDL